MTSVEIEFPSKPNYVLATASDTAAQGYLTVLAYDPSKTAGRQFTLGADGYIHLASSPDLVLDVSGGTAHEGNRVCVFPKKTPAADNQLWENKNGVVFSKLAGEQYSLALEDNGNVVISTTRQTLVIGYQGYLETTQGQTSNPTQPLTQFTVTAVISLQAPWTGRIVDKISAGHGDGWLLDIYPVHCIRVISNSSTFNSHIKINDSTKTYLAATYGIPTSGVYVNGAKTDSPVLHAPPQNAFPIRIGFDSNHQNQFPGTIQRARIYYTALTDAQIQADYQDAKSSLGF